MWGELGKSLKSSSAVLNFLIHHILEPVVVFVGDGGFGVIYLSPYYCEAQKCYCSSFLNFLLFWNSSMSNFFFFSCSCGWIGTCGFLLASNYSADTTFIQATFDSL